MAHYIQIRCRQRKSLTEYLSSFSFGFRNIRRISQSTHPQFIACLGYEHYQAQAGNSLHFTLIGMILLVFRQIKLD
jgi:hypothetical protein